MKIHVLSDLHIEFAPFEPPSTDADVVVLAGDAHVGLKGLEWALRTFLDKPVLYVFGNHEFYRHDFRTLVHKGRALTGGTNVAVLENDEIRFGGIRFLGCTLWTDFGLLGDFDIASAAAASAMNDYRLIRVSPRYRRLRPADTVVAHSKSRDWLEGKLRGGFEGKTVVVTHHAPSLSSVPPAYRIDLVSAAFASNLDGLVEASGSVLWIHGHNHGASDYEIGATRVLCNPRGYPDERGTGFRPDLVIQI